MRRGPGTFRILPAVGLLAAGLCTGASVHTPTETPPGNNSCVGLYDCLPGILLPTWLPQDPSPGDKAARAIVYFVAMVYMFLGMSIIADRFMASIEVITSQEREVVVKKPNGETFTTMVRVWNETVSNLTLMALGSSAPEILLSIIEVCGHNFEPGELGPATIVGSAAFNMFVIMAICISVVPDGEHRKIKHLRVFFVTAFWSIFAYVWLYLILSVFSPGEVQIWEAVVTFAFFPCLVLLAWVADRRLLMYRYLHKHYRADKRRNIVVQVTGSDSSSPKADVEMDGVSKASQDPPDSWPGWQQPEEETRRVVTGILKDLRQKHPEKEPEQLLEMANYQALLHQQKSRAFYRIHATRCMTGEGNILKRHAAEQTRRVLSVPLQAPEYPLHQGVSLSFQPARYQCFENCGWVHLTVVREGGREDLPVAVDYRTEDGTALAGADYEATRGTLRFGPGQSRLLLPVRIIDDDIYEQDEFFRVRLSSPRPDGKPGAVTATGTGTPPSSTPTTTQVSLGTNSQATVTIFDDDHAGLFSFELCSQRVNESVGSMAVTIMRTSGSRGLVQLPYSTSPGTARPGEDYVEQNGMLVFQNDETLKNIEIQIIDDEEYEKNKNFFIELGEPVLVENKAEEMSDDVAKLGCPSLGETTKMEVIIEESYEFKSTVDKLMKKTNLALVVSSSSWREQFVNAVTVSAGEDDDDEGSSDDRLPSCFDYIMHFLTVFWKVLFAFVPPTEYMNGWACFVVSISLIGLLTALTGDLATQFGCTIGLKSSVTAIVFVALGTSVPDTFASKVAAIQDQYADASIGNVTGSNAVNVFLGIGVAWTIAAVYWAAQGKKFLVEPGNLAFSVTIFTICAFLAVATLMYRRRPEVGGELGGPRASKYFTSCLFIALWLAYIILSSLEAYCYIPGF